MPNRAEQWIRSLDVYYDNKSKQKALADPNEFINNNQSEVVSLLKSEKSREHLYKGASNESVTTAREAYLHYLEEQLAKLPPQKKKPRPEIKLEALLGAEGLRLYQAAIEEESKSKAFRNAVFLSSTRTYDGPKWLKKLILWVGGPSASGKSFGADLAVQEATKDAMPKSDTNLEKNHVVSIDGGIERKLSQIRQMTLQAALSKGYKSVTDLNRLTKLGIKRHVKAASLNEPDLGLVIPNTFTSSLVPGKNFLKGKEMQEYNDNDNILQAMAVVVAEKPAEENGFRNDLSKEFKKNVEKSGNSRADLAENVIFDDGMIEMNNLDLPESKKYSGGIKFIAGVKASYKAVSNFVKLSNHGPLIEVESNLIFLKEVKPGTWRETKPGEIHELKLSRLDFYNWSQYCKEEELNNRIPQNLNEWYKNLESKSMPKITQGQSLENRARTVSEIVEIEVVNAEKSGLSSDWEIAKKRLKAEKEKTSNLSGLKIRKKDTGLDNSFIYLKDINGRDRLFRMAGSGEILGIGNSGKVKVLEDESGQKYVVKIMPSLGNRLEENEITLMKETGLLVGEFIREREAKTTDKYLHRDVGDKRYLVQPLLPGQELHSILKERTLTEPQKLQLAYGAAAAISDLHASNILHRDIKAANFIADINVDGNIDHVAVIDMGAGLKMTDPNGKEDATIGTPGFIAPEVQGKEISNLIAEYQKALKNEQDVKVLGDDEVLAEAQQQTAEIKRNLDSKMNEPKLYTLASDVYSLGIVFKHQLKIDLAAVGLGNMLSENPNERPSMKEVKTALFKSAYPELEVVQKLLDSKEVPVKKHPILKRFARKIFRPQNKEELIQSKVLEDLTNNLYARLDKVIADPTNATKHGDVVDAALILQSVIKKFESGKIRSQVRNKIRNINNELDSISSYLTSDKATKYPTLMKNKDGSIKLTSQKVHQESSLPPIAAPKTPTSDSTRRHELFLGGHRFNSNKSPEVEKKVENQTQINEIVTNHPKKP